MLPSSHTTYHPLRRFAAEGLYSARYLSQLVQRGRLPAKRIGRNYCTTREDFETYLRHHGKDGVREAYRELFRQADQEQARREQAINESLRPKPSPALKLNPGIIRYFWLKVTAIIIAVIFVSLGLANVFVRLDSGQGTVAGGYSTSTRIYAQ